MKFHIACLKMVDRFNRMSPEDKQANFPKLVSWLDGHENYLHSIERGAITDEGAVTYYFVRYTNPIGETRTFRIKCYEYEANVSWWF